MNSQFFYHTALVAHIIGLTMMAGTTLISYITGKHFWREYALDKAKGKQVIQTISKFQMLNGIGILLLVASGMTMMGFTHGIYGEQTWFRIKFGIVVIVIINGLGVGRRLGGKLRKVLTAASPVPNADAQLMKIKGNMQLFYTLQLALFATIFILSVFKFN